MMTAIRRTALFQTHQRAGASLTEHHGWQIPAYFAGALKEAEQLSASAALGDVSWMTKLDLKGYGLKRPPVVSEARAWKLGQRRYLITCEPAVSDAVMAQLRPPSAITSGLQLPQAIYVTDVTSGFAQFLLAGPRSHDILQKLTSFNAPALQNLGCGQASLAHVHSTILRDDLQGVPAFHILVSREYGEGIWQAILHAGHEFHLSPFGLQALQLLGAQP